MGLSDGNFNSQDEFLISLVPRKAEALNDKSLEPRGLDFNFSFRISELLTRESVI